VVLHPFDEPSIQLYRFFLAAAFVWVLVVIAFIDLDHKLILNRITYPAIPIFYGLATLLPERGWKGGLIGAAVGYGVIRLVADGYHLLTRRRGLGYGDGKLLAIVGAYLGWQSVLVALFLGSIIGSVVGGLWLLAARARAGKADGDVPLRHVEIPFGPFLATAALIYAFVEPWLRVDFAILYS
jgi:leader peptidase (prepilin peptidase)/N-methyltransferase